MTARQFPLDFNAHLRQEPDGSFTIVVEISGIPSLEMADHVSNWLRAAIRDKADLLGALDSRPRRH